MEVSALRYETYQYRALLAFVVIAAEMLTVATGGAAAETPAEAYAKGCGGCHQSERLVLRKFARLPQIERRASIERFMAQHPCERDDLKPLIVEYLLRRTTQ